MRVQKSLRLLPLEFANRLTRLLDTDNWANLKNSIKEKLIMTLNWDKLAYGQPVNTVTMSTAANAMARLLHYFTLENYQTE